MDTERKLKVLVITNLPWREDSNVGNTLSNIFDGMEGKIEFANIYFRNGLPQNNLVHKYFHISENKLIKSIFSHKPVGEELTNINSWNNSNIKLSSSYNKARQIRWEVFLLAQDLIGKIGKWKSDALDEFVSDFQPDLIFGPLGRVPVVNDVMVYLHEKFNIPLITYPWDDHYSLKKLSISPFFWMKTFLERSSIKSCADASEYLYTITENMQKEYNGFFDKECRILYKGYHFDEITPVKKELGAPIKIIYMGNIGSGRWQILAKVADALTEINQDGQQGELFIYTLSPKSNKIAERLNISGSSNLMDAVPSEQVLSTMKSADILLHVEPTTLKERLFFRLSFSTKLVDYFYNARCIFAVGGKTAAMEYLKGNDAAVVELDHKKIKHTLSLLLSDKNKIKEYAEKGWKCGVKNHQLATIQENIYNDFCQVIRMKQKF